MSSSARQALRSLSTPSGPPPCPLSGGTIIAPALTRVADGLAFTYDGGMSDSEKPLGEQLTEAMANIRHQLDLLRSGPNIGGLPDDRSVIADLGAEYEGLREAKANLGPGDR